MIGDSSAAACLTLLIFQRLSDLQTLGAFSGRGISTPGRLTCQKIAVGASLQVRVEDAQLMHVGLALLQQHVSADVSCAVYRLDLDERSEVRHVVYVELGVVYPPDLPTLIHDDQDFQRRAEDVKETTGVAHLVQRDVGVLGAGLV